MRFVKPPAFYTWCFIISMPFITFALCYIMYGGRLFHEWKLWAYGYLLIYAIGYASWRMHYQYDHFLQTKFPGIEHTRQRALYKLLIYVLIMSPSVLLIIFVFHYFHVGGYTIGRGDITNALLVGLTTNIVFETLYEVVYIIEKYKETAVEAQLLEHMHLRQEFDNLQQKVNPHFLFNCFNTLSSLISEDKQQANKFLNELSKVYRYLLQNNEDGMSTVESEMKFIESYFQLISTRYGDGVRMSLRIEKKYYPYFVPSLSLQLLVENAVKHNIVSKQSPLAIEIFTTEGKQLVVNNNLNRKILKEKSTRIGLQNIESKYKLMSQDGFRVVNDEKNFMVVLPMLWKQPETMK
ncbi:MAG TPA: histidine kinase [Parafilimonas sp.]|nr:histidine kinase [Parafilimonas sp.]